MENLKKYTMEDLENDYCGDSKLNLKQCACCEGVFERNDMDFTRDCYGITYRLVCLNCWEKLMEKGYDGQMYNEFDENIYDY